jgi:2'-5' RNA ligase
MTSLYFIAIIPDEQLRKEVTDFKNFMTANYSSKAALTSPPHITLYPPFKIESIKENIIIDSLHDFVKGKAPFSVSLNGFGCFKPRVIYIRPEYSIELNNLQKQLLLHLTTTVELGNPQNEWPYNPHMTIANRDLQKKLFYEAWEIFHSRKFFRKFPVESIFLLKHNGKYWDILEEFGFYSE